MIVGILMVGTEQVVNKELLEVHQERLMLKEGTGPPRLPSAARGCAALARIRGRETYF